MKLYTIRDVLAGYGVQPGVPAILNLPNDELMIRVIKGSVQEGCQPNALNTNIEDKEVWCIGEFDDKTGRITPCDPYLVARCVDLVEKGLKVDDTKAN